MRCVTAASELRKFGIKGNIGRSGTKEKGNRRRRKKKKNRL
jgi:hypothetical protein